MFLYMLRHWPLFKCNGAVLSSVHLIVLLQFQNGPVKLSLRIIVKGEVMAGWGK